MRIVAVLAMTDNCLIGSGNGLPWDIPEDMKHFREVTKGGVVIMGRSTYFSIPEQFRPLPGRRNIVLSRTAVDGVESYSSIETLLHALRHEGIEKIFVIGGASIYDQFFEQGLVDEVELSLVHGERPGDVFVREFRQDFDETTRVVGEQCTFVNLVRKQTRL